MRAIEQRLAKLEQAATAETTVCAWVEAGETAEQAIARRFPEGVPNGATVMVYRWADT